jgi:hypothetical protein
LRSHAVRLPASPPPIITRSIGLSVLIVNRHSAIVCARLERHRGARVKETAKEATGGPTSPQDLPLKLVSGYAVPNPGRPRHFPAQGNACRKIPCNLQEFRKPFQFYKSEESARASSSKVASPVLQLNADTCCNPELPSLKLRAVARNSSQFITLTASYHACTNGLN